VIGFLAEHAGLPVALATVALLAGVAAVLVLALDGTRVRVPSLPGPGWVVPVATGLRPVAVRVRGGAGAYVRDLQLLTVG
jgi:hypothetical protein